MPNDGRIVFWTRPSFGRAIWPARLQTYVTATVSGVRRPSTIGFGRDCRLVDVRFCPRAPNKDRVRSVAFGRTPVLETPKLGSRIMRYELAEYEGTALKPMLPNKPRGVPRLNDRRVLNGIFRVLRSGAPGVICPRRLVRIPLLITTALSGGGERVFGAVSYTHLPAPIMPAFR